MGLADIGALIDSDRRAAVYADTWGHLAPENGQTYTGSILFAHSGYGDGTVPMDADFAELPDSPWFYDGMCEFLLDHRERDREGKVYRWTGTYQLRTWPRIWNEDGSDTIQDAGHEHVFEGVIVEIPTAAPAVSVPGEGGEA